MATTPSLLGLGTSALGAYRSALTVTSNNISNVGVEGYSRQRADLELADSLQTAGGYMGNGVDTVDVTRSYDQFLTRNLNSAISSGGHYDSYYKYASSIDEMVADPESGMTPAIGSFFNAMQDLSNNPSSIPARQVMYGEGEALVSRFNTIHREMENVREQTVQEMDSIVATINGISASVAELNHRIAKSSAGGTGQPNELLDRRDTLITELSEYIGVTTLERDGIVDIYIGKGQSLVAGSNFNELSMGDSQYQSDDVHLYMKQGDRLNDITSAIKGGSIGGIVDFTNEILTPAENSLGRIALSLSATLNAQHMSGYGLGGETDTGKTFFDLGEMSVDADGRPIMELKEAITNSTSAAELSVSIPMSNGVLETGAMIATAVDSNPISGLMINGILINDVAAGVATATTTADEETANNLVDAINLQKEQTGVTAVIGEDNKVKLLSEDDISISEKTGGDISSSGLEEKTYRMVKGAVKQISTDDYALSYNGTSYVITNQTSGAQRVLSDSEGSQLTNMSASNMGVVHDGLTLKLNTFNGLMKEGEKIEIRATRSAAQNIGLALNSGDISSIAASDAADESGNNSNVLNMIALQTDKILSANANGNPSASLQDGYGQLVSNVGIQTHYADVNRVAQESIRNNAQNARDNNAAVNLDEEAANLMKFQQMYQASTKVISMADKLFQSVLNAV